MYYCTAIYIYIIYVQLYPHAYSTYVGRYIQYQTSTDWLISVLTSDCSEVAFEFHLLAESSHSRHWDDSKRVCPDSDLSFEVSHRWRRQIWAPQPQESHRWLSSNALQSQPNTPHTSPTRHIIVYLDLGGDVHVKNKWGRSSSGLRLIMIEALCHMEIMFCKASRLKVKCVILHH